MVLNNVKELKTKKFLTHAMAKLDEDTVIHLVKKGLDQGIAPLTLIEEATAGMIRVGELYKSGHYFLADMIVAAEIFQDMLKLVLNAKTVAPAQNYQNYPPIIFGTVEDDIHDIGKNITIGVLKGNGFQVHDLGVDVPAYAFVEAVQKTGSPLVCLSGLITSAYDSMKKTVNILEKEGYRPGVSVVIGGLVNEAVKKYTGADYWVTDCAAGSELCERILRAGIEKSALSS
ncbi:MAG: cobalamin-dependent protein [Peptococcaceae bacterium]|nr:cobalamin-dependent protein [Peptococcaceae bacterium]